MDKYPLLRDQVEKIVVQHGRKGEAKSKDQVLDGVICSGVFFILFAWTWDAQSVVVGSIFKGDVFMFQFKAHNENAIQFFLNLDLAGVSSVNVFWEWKTRENSF